MVGWLALIVQTKQERVGVMKPQVVVTLLVLIFVFAGCATTPHPMESGVRTQTTEPIFVEPGGSTVCVFFGDNSGHGVDLRPIITQKLQAKGLQVVADQDSADYIVNCRLTYLGYCKDYPDQEALGRILGTATGAGAGMVIGNQASNQYAGRMIGGTLGGVLGYVIGNEIDKANTPDLYFGELHVLVKQRLTFLADRPDERPITSVNKVTTTTTTGGKTAVSSTETKTETLSTPVESNLSVAQSGKGNFKTVTGQKVADYESHQTTFSGVAKVVKTDTAVAVGQLGDYFAQSVAGIFWIYGRRFPY